MTNHIGIIVRSQKLSQGQVENRVNIMKEGAIVHFIPQYGKELTEYLDKLLITLICDERINYVFPK